MWGLVLLTTTSNSKSRYETWITENLVLGPTDKLEVETLFEFKDGTRGLRIKVIHNDK